MLGQGRQLPVGDARRVHPHGDRVIGNGTGHEGRIRIDLLPGRSHRLVHASEVRLRHRGVEQALQGRTRLVRGPSGPQLLTRPVERLGRGLAHRDVVLVLGHALRAERHHDVGTGLAQDRRDPLHQLGAVLRSHASVRVAQEVHGGVGAAGSGQRGAFLRLPHLRQVLPRRQRGIGDHPRLAARYHHDRQVHVATQHVRPGQHPRVVVGVGEDRGQPVPLGHPYDPRLTRLPGGAGDRAAVPGLPSAPYGWPLL